MNERYALEACDIQSPLKFIFPFALHSFVQGVATLVRTATGVVCTAQGMYLEDKSAAIGLVLMRRSPLSPCDCFNNSLVGGYWLTTFLSVANSCQLLTYFICDVTIVRTGVAAPLG